MIEIHTHLVPADFHNPPLQPPAQAVHHRQHISHRHLLCLHIFENVLGQIHDHILIHQPVGIRCRNLEIKRIPRHLFQQIHFKILQRLPLTANKRQRLFCPCRLNRLSFRFRPQLITYGHMLILCNHLLLNFKNSNPRKDTKNFQPPPPFPKILSENKSGCATRHTRSRFSPCLFLIPKEDTQTGTYPFHPYQWRMHTNGRCPYSNPAPTPP